jgi:hypothetical protein
MLDRPLWLSRSVRERELSVAMVQRICHAGSAVFRRFERLVRPRLAFMHAHPHMRRVTGAIVVVAGLLLALPLPIPISNFLPALTIGLVALGTLEEDGVVVAVGYVAFILCLAFFAGLIVLPFFGAREVWTHWRS